MSNTSSQRTISVRQYTAYTRAREHMVLAFKMVYTIWYKNYYNSSNSHKNDDDSDIGDDIDVIY